MTNAPDKTYKAHTILSDALMKPENEVLFGKELLLYAQNNMPVITEVLKSEEIVNIELFNAAYNEGRVEEISYILCSILPAVKEFNPTEEELADFMNEGMTAHLKHKLEATIPEWKLCQLLANETISKAAQLTDKERNALITAMSLLVGRIDSWFTREETIGALWAVLQFDWEAEKVSPGQTPFDNDLNAASFAVLMKSTIDDFIRRRESISEKFRNIPSKSYDLGEDPWG